MYHKRAFFFGFLRNSNNYLSYLLKYTLSLSRQQPWKKKSSKVPFKENASPVRCPVLGIFFLANLLWRGVAVKKKRAKVKPRFRSFLQALSSKKNLKNRSSPKAIEIRRKWQRHHKEHTLKPLAKFSFIPTSNGRWPGSWQIFQLDSLLPHFFRNHGLFLKLYLLNYNFA